MKIKKTILSILASCFSNYAFAGMDRYFGSPDMGLPDGETVGIGAAIGVVALIIGFVIIKATDKNDNTVGGCITMLCFGIAFVCFVPLLFWICAIASSIWLIGVVAVAVVFIIGFVVSLFKK